MIDANFGSKMQPERSLISKIIWGGGYASRLPRDKLWWPWRSRVMPVAVLRHSRVVMYHSSDSFLSLQWLSHIIPVTVLHHSSGIIPVIILRHSSGCPLLLHAFPRTNMNFELFFASQLRPLIAKKSSCE